MRLSTSRIFYSHYEFMLVSTFTTVETRNHNLRA